MSATLVHSTIATLLDLPLNRLRRASPETLAVVLRVASASLVEAVNLNESADLYVADCALVPGHQPGSPNSHRATKNTPSTMRERPGGRSIMREGDISPPSPERHLVLSRFVTSLVHGNTRRDPALDRPLSDTDRVYLANAETARNTPPFTALR